MTPIIIAKYTDFGSANIFKTTLENYTGYSSNADFLMSYLILTKYLEASSTDIAYFSNSFQFCSRYLPTSETPGTANSQSVISSGGGQYAFQSQPCAYIHLQSTIQYSPLIGTVQYIYFLKDGRVYTSATGSDIPSNSTSGYTQVYRLK